MQHRIVYNRGGRAFSFNSSSGDLKGEPLRDAHIELASPFSVASIDQKVRPSRLKSCTLVMPCSTGIGNYKLKSRTALGPDWVGLELSLLHRYLRSPRAEFPLDLLVASRSIAPPCGATSVLPLIPAAARAAELAKCNVAVYADPGTPDG